MAADFNGDGKLDLAVAYWIPGEVGILMGNGDGTFQAPTMYAAGDPKSLAVADLNGDGKLDLVVGGQGAAGLTILRNRGDGTFDDSSVTIGTHSNSVAISDINGDGKPDIVADSIGYDQVTVLFNTTGIPPAVGLTLNDRTAPEGDAGATAVPITVNLSVPITSPVTVHYSTGGGTATPGIDYTPLSGTLTFATGTTSRTFDVPVIGNLRVDGDRTVGLTLTDPTNGGTLARGQGTLMIRDDERPSVIGFRTTLIAADPLADRAFIAVVRDDGRSEGVTVHHATAGGSAVAGVDYTPVAGTLHFSPGESILFVTVPILGDPLLRTGRTIGLALSDPAGGGVLGASSTATIRLDGPPSGPVAAESVAMPTGRGGPIRVAFSGALDARSARKPRNYILISAGRDGKFGTRDDRRVAIKTATYNPTTHTVTLTPRAARFPKGPSRLKVAPTLVDTRGVSVAGKATVRRGWYAVAHSGAKP